MPVVQVRIVDMLVAHRLMAVPVRMWFGDRFVVTMAVMRIMNVGVLVFQRLVDVIMLVLLGQVQPEAQPHQGARRKKLQRHRFAQ